MALQALFASGRAGPRYTRCNNAAMANKRKRRKSLLKRPLQRTFIRAWRDHRQLSLERLSARLEDLAPGLEGTTAASLSRIERAIQPYNQPLLEALAIALDCAVADLISRPPGTRKGELLRAVEALPAEREQQALDILRTFDRPREPNAA